MSCFSQVFGHSDKDNYDTQNPSEKPFNGPWHFKGIIQKTGTMPTRPEVGTLL